VEINTGRVEDGEIDKNSEVRVGYIG